MVCVSGWLAVANMKRRTSPFTPKTAAVDAELRRPPYKGGLASAGRGWQRQGRAKDAAGEKNCGKYEAHQIFYAAESFGWQDR